MARTRNANAQPYYDLTKRMGKGRPFRAYTDAARELKRELGRERRNPDAMPAAPRTRTRKRHTGLLIGAALVGAYVWVARRSAAPATTTTTAATPTSSMPSL